MPSAADVVDGDNRTSGHTVRDPLARSPLVTWLSVVCDTRTNEATENFGGGVVGPRSGPLDLHEGISDPATGGCPRWPENLRLLNDRGEAVRGRCRATNLCAYCARLAAVENSELLALDALAGIAPTIWAVLTTRTATLETARFYRSREAVLKALRRRWPQCEIAALVEFTTGYGKRSGGRRRPHWNLLIKGIPREHVDQVRDVIVSTWTAREDATREAQHVGVIKDAGGLMRYIALHFQKESQKPPAGWRGHRFLKTRGYLGTSTPEAREAARRSLRFKRELWRAIRNGVQGEMAELEAHLALEEADERSWQLVHLNLTSQRMKEAHDGPAGLGSATASAAQGAGAPDAGTEGTSGSPCAAPVGAGVDHDRCGAGLVGGCASTGPGTPHVVTRGALPGAVLVQPDGAPPGDRGRTSPGGPAACCSSARTAGGRRWRTARPTSGSASSAGRS